MKITHVIILLSFLAATLFFMYPATDVDLGWHLRYGDSFLETGKLLRQNTFSWLMPDYEWPNHSWGFDIVTSFLYQRGGFLLLTIVGGILTGSAFLIAHSANPILMPLTLPVFLYIGSHLLNNGLRSQMFSLLFFSYLISLLFRYFNTKKAEYLKYIPAIFLLWANIHGQFILGLGTIGLFLVYELFRKSHRDKTVIKKMWQLLILSTIATLINPYGLNLIPTALSHLSSPALQYIFEWIPWETNSLRFAVFIIYAVIFFFLLKIRKADALYYFIAAVYLIFALKSRRLIPFFLVTTFVIVSINLPKTLFDRYQKVLALATLILLFFIGLFILPSRQLTNQSWDRLCRSHIRCSESLVVFLNSHPLEGKVFTDYRLGGHLIYRYPNMPVFIDGRMTLWQDSNGFLPFMEYITMVHMLDGSESLFFAYDFDYVIIHPEFALSQTLEKELQWPIIYQDEFVRVYQNPR